MKGKTFILRIIIVLIFITIPHWAFGQFEGPKSSDRLYTIQEIKATAYKLDRNDDLVKLKGYILRQINYELYEFKDETGSIILEIDQKILPKIPFNEDTKLIVIGEVDLDLFKPVEVEVKELFIEGKNRLDGL